MVQLNPTGVTIKPISLLPFSLQRIFILTATVMPLAKSFDASLPKLIQLLTKVDNFAPLNLPNFRFCTV